MKSFSEITNEIIKDQLNEYHTMVSEILSGMDAELTSLRNENSALRASIDQLFANAAVKETEAGEIRNRIRILQKEVVILMAKHDSLKDYTEHGFMQVFRRGDE